MSQEVDRITLDEVNGLDGPAFVALLGGIFEDSPWVAEGAWESRPFASIDDLHGAMVAVVRHADADSHLDLLRAHPDLAGRLAETGQLTASSTAEQASAGLDRLTSAEKARFNRLNRAYRDKFGFPFIIAVREHSKQSILDRFEARLGNTADQETQTALEEVFKIARLRLAQLFGA